MEHGESVEGAPVVRVLHAEGCAGFPHAYANAEAAMLALGLQGRPVAILVDDHVTAVRLGFRGSPTVTVNGRDVTDVPHSDPGLVQG